jgi:hypothetical protein
VTVNIIILSGTFLQPTQNSMSGQFNLTSIGSLSGLQSFASITIEDMMINVKIIINVTIKTKKGV